MSKSPSSALFINEFVSVNKESYKDNPETIDMLNKVTVENTVFKNLKKFINDDKVCIVEADLKSNGVIVGIKQSWTPAEYQSEIAFTVNQEPLLPEELEEVTSVGMYEVLDGTGDVPGMAVICPTLETEQLTVGNALRLINGYCNYDLTKDSYQVKDRVVLLTDPTIVGRILIVDNDITLSELASVNIGDL